MSGLSKETGSLPRVLYGIASGVILFSTGNFRSVFHGVFCLYLGGLGLYR